MTPSSPPSPKSTVPSGALKKTRQTRLERALKQNLQRRKVQTRTVADTKNGEK